MTFGAGEAHVFHVPEDLAMLQAGPPGICDLIRRFLVSWRVMEVAEALTANEVLAAEHRLGLRLPYALRWAFMHIGFDNRIVGRQDPFVHPQDLEVDTDGVLIYRIENQSCAAWGFPVADAGMDDPPVIWKSLQAGSEGRWLPYHERISVDLLEMVLNEAMLRPGATSCTGSLCPVFPPSFPNSCHWRFPNTHSGQHPKAHPWCGMERGTVLFDVTPTSGCGHSPGPQLPSMG